VAAGGSGVLRIKTTFVVDRDRESRAGFTEASGMSTTERASPYGTPL
jgi:hypothetical protein